MNENGVPSGASELLRYYEKLAEKFPQSPHWQNGVELCQRWLRLASQGHVTQADIDEFVTRLDSEPQPGSGWLDLGLRFRHWAFAPPGTSQAPGGTGKL